VKRLVGVAVLLMLPSAAFAQGNPGPFGGLFGRTPERVGREYTLFDLRGSSSLRLDDEVLKSTGRPTAGVGTMAVLGGSVSLDHQSTRLQSLLRTRAQYHQYLQSQPTGATTVDSNAAATWKVATRLSVDVSAAYLYSPYFQFYPNFAAPLQAPGMVAPVVPYITGLIASDTVDAMAGFTSAYSKQSSVNMSVWRRYTAFRDDRAPDLESTHLRALWTRRMNRSIGIRLGYTREETNTAALDDVDYLQESIEAGIDLSRPISLSRSTTLAFYTDSSIISRDGGARHFRLNGGVDLAHRFNRTWNLAVNFRRDTEFLPGFVEPLFSDTLGASLSGLFSPRMELLLSAFGGNGRFGVGDEAHGRYRSAMASSQFSFALTRNFGVFAQHGFYFYDLPAGASSLPTMQRMARQTVTVGGTVWLPVINRERSPSDSR
jgi:hypothetical protein